LGVLFLLERSGCFSNHFEIKEILDSG